MAGYQPTQAVQPVLARVSNSEIHPVAHWESQCDKEPLSSTQTHSLRRPYTRLTRSGSSAASLFISTLVPRPSSYPTPTGGSFTSSVRKCYQLQFNHPLPHRQLPIAPEARHKLPILALSRLADRRLMYAPPTSSTFSLKS